MPPVCIGDEQGAVVVKDGEDAHAELALIGCEVRDVVTATNLELNPAAAADRLGAVVRKEPKRGGDIHVAA
jgi:hypothetical protein